MTYIKSLNVAVLILLNASVLILETPTRASDWPMWRRDSNRSAATDQELPDRLFLQWTHQLPRLKPAWPEDSRLHFDANYEPIVVGRTMYVASSRNDSLAAIDTRTGQDKWRFYAGGPIRFAPVAHSGRLFFGADDGHFYCLDSSNGEVIWQFRTAPADRRVIGNERLISVWPLRGGPVISDSKIYFTVGVWPFEGTFLYTLDLESGAEQSKQRLPASTSLTLTDRTPQGYLAVAGNRLYIPCGRSQTTCVDLDLGKLLPEFGYRTHGTSDYHISAIDRWLFHGGVSYDTGSRNTLSISAKRPVLTQEAAFFGDQGDIVAVDLTNPEVVESKDRRGRTKKTVQLSERWRLPHQEIQPETADIKTEDYPQWATNHPLVVAIKAGSRLYAHQDSEILGVDLNADDGPRVSWRTEVDGTPASVLAADDRLFVVTKQGRLCCYGSSEISPRSHVAESNKRHTPDDGWSNRVSELLERAAGKTGYALVIGADSPRPIEELLTQSEFRIVVIDPDEERVNEVRRHFDSLGVYGTRVAAQTADPLEVGLPPYFANLVIVGNSNEIDSDNIGRLARAVFHVVRPYGGTAFLELNDAQRGEFTQAVERLELPNAATNQHSSWTQLTRVGALPGSADWTHEYGDSSNTLMSGDTLVKAPLGVLWFGGPASDGSLFYNRHYWGPSMAVIGGRMFIQGPSKLSAVDVYTGQVLWQKDVQENKKINEGRRGNNFEKVLAGFHFLAVEDGIYFVDGRGSCLRIDPANGKELSRFSLPSPDSSWGRIRVKDDLLITSVFRKLEADAPVKSDEMLPVELLAMNRHTGDVVWKKRANLSFPFVSISGDTVYCFDGAIEGLYRDWDRKGLLPEAAADRYLLALDLKTGEQRWKYSTDIIATWLGYSANRDVLIVSNKMGMTAYRGRDGTELWKKYAEGKGFRGHPEALWDKVILWNDRVIDQRGPGHAYDLETGEDIQRVNPLTGEMVSWEFTKTGHHCNYAIASPHLLTFRADTAGFCDIESGNTSRLEGFRSGCRNSLIPANGVLNAPNFANGCVCGYSLFTSLALVHRPETEVWSYSALKLDPDADQVKQVGINFGAPGDRLSANGTLWIDYPNVGGSSPALSVELDEKNPQWFNAHSAFVQGDALNWVASSGLVANGPIKIGMTAKSESERPYTVRLVFSEPHDQSRGQRVFDVSLQGDMVLKDFDIVQEAGEKRRQLVREFKHVPIAESLTVGLTASQGQPVICGIEIVAEEGE